jgi:tRNA 2-selenouridine synthase
MICQGLYITPMANYEILDDISPESLAKYDQILDVRSPAEFAEDHLPGAINLPVLDDEERAIVGTTYKQVSPFAARKQGAALVARNISQHIKLSLSDKDAGYRPLIHCWRGGMRSRSMALVLSAIGWQVTLLRGGYQTWRREVVACLEKDGCALPIVLIDGQTGVAKTAVLEEMSNLGAQTIDLEGMANHRGSVFGGHPQSAQPSQKYFETCIWNKLRAMDFRQPVYVEAESSLVGVRRVPARLWKSMKTAPRVTIHAAMIARAKYLVGAYPELISDRDRLCDAIDQLASRHSKTLLETWHQLASDGAHRELAEQLITHHYDPAYNRARVRREARSALSVHTETLDPPAIAKLAREILAQSVETA